MKNTKLIKIVTLVLSCLLLVGAVIGISVSAANDPEVTIKAKNISYEGAIKVLYAVDAQNVPEGAEVKMYFYTAKDGEVAYEKVAHSEDITIGDATYKTFFSNGIAPKNMRTPIYAKAVIVDAEGEILAESAVAEYSIWQYATNRFAKNPTEDQLFLYTAMLDYGASVQKMLVESGKMTEQDVIDAGGWADTYCGVRQNTVYNGVTVETGDVTFSRKGEAVTLTASNTYGTDGIFSHFADSEGNSLADGAYPKLTIEAKNSGVCDYTANYKTTGYTFETFDSYTVDGSANDVNILHKGKTLFTARDNMGVYMNSETFGNASTASKYTRIDKDASNTSNNVFNVGANGSSGGNAFSFTMDHAVNGAEKYITQFDLNYHGRTDTAGGEPIYIRFQTSDLTDQNDLLLIALDDSGTANDTYTIWGTEFNKNESYTIRFEFDIKNRAFYDVYMYVNGELAKSSLNTTPGANAPSAVNNVDSFIGVRFFNRKATNYSYSVDNVYVGVEGERKTGEGKYANNEKTYGFGDGTTLGNVTINGIPSPAEISNGVYSVGQSLMAFKNPGATTGEKYVFETDFRVEPGTVTKAGDQLSWFGFAANTRDKKQFFASFGLHYTAENGKIKAITINRNDTNTSLLATLFPDCWYNIRIEYTPTGSSSGNIELFINGSVVASYNAKGYGNASIANDQFISFVSEFRGSASGASSDIRYIFDNTYIGAESNPGYGNGAYYNNSELAGTRYDGTTLDNLFTEGSEGSSYFSANNGYGYISMYPALNSKNHNSSISAYLGIANNVPEGADALPEGNVHVFETDIRLVGGISTKPRENLGWFGMSATTTKKEEEFLPLNLKLETDETNTVTGLAIYNHKVNDAGAKVAVIPVGDWYNLRFVYTVDNTVDDTGAVTDYKGNVEVFINNVSVYTYTTSGYEVSDSNDEINNVFSNMVLQIRTQNLTGSYYLDMDLDNIFLGTFNTAE